MLVLGTVFDARDLLVYVPTVAVACAIDAAIGAVVRGRVGRAGARAAASAHRDMLDRPAQ